MKTKPIASEEAIDRIKEHAQDMCIHLIRRYYEDGGRTKEGTLEAIKRHMDVGDSMIDNIIKDTEGGD